MKKIWLIALALVAVLTCTATMLALPAMAEDLDAECVHLWDTGVVTVERTHTSTGVKLFTCKKCGETDERETPKLPMHVYGEWTALDEKQHQRVCECGEVQVLSHFWDAVELVSEATHLEDGLEKHTCRDCGAVKEVVLNKTTAHTFGEWMVGASGMHVANCECGETKSGAHLWDAGKVTTEPTHTTTGVKTFTCKHCSAIKTQVLAALPVHRYGDWTSVDENQHSKTCACGEASYQNHVWDDGVITTEATMHGKGVKTYTCVDCGATKEESVPSIYAVQSLERDRELQKFLPEDGAGIGGLAILVVLAIIAFSLKKKVIR